MSGATPEPVRICASSELVDGGAGVQRALRFIEENRFPANRVKVVTERQVVYLMGMVTHREADDAAQIAAATTDVVRVVKVFEYIG